MRIVTIKKFDKQFKKQPKKIKKKFQERMEIFFDDINNPILNTHKLSGDLKDLWSFNVSGDVRVIFDTSFENMVLLVSIGTHSELYK